MPITDVPIIIDARLLFKDMDKFLAAFAMKYRAAVKSFADQTASKPVDSDAWERYLKDFFHDASESPMTDIKAHDVIDFGLQRLLFAVSGFQKFLIAQHISLEARRETEKYGDDVHLPLAALDFETREKIMREADNWADKALSLDGSKLTVFFVSLNDQNLSALLGHENVGTDDFDNFIPSVKEYLIQEFGLQDLWFLEAEETNTIGLGLEEVNQARHHYEDYSDAAYGNALVLSKDQKYIDIMQGRGFETLFIGEDEITPNVINTINAWILKNIGNQFPFVHENFSSLRSKKLDP